MASSIQKCATESPTWQIFNDRDMPFSYIKHSDEVDSSTCTAASIRANRFSTVLKDIGLNIKVLECPITCFSLFPVFRLLSCIVVFY